MSFFSSARSGLWWNHLILPLSFWVYLVSFRQQNILESSLTCIHILIASGSIAVLGYLINDYFDKQVDEQAGKSNFFHGKGKYSALLIPLLIALASFLWFLLPIQPGTICLLLAELTLLFVYSSPPFRLKNTWAGVPVDALYSRVIPVLTILSLWPDLDVLVFTVSGLWMFVVGLRNILLHQMDDLENDNISGVKTVVQQIGVSSSQNIILKYLLPIEMLFSIVAIVLLSEYVNSIYLAIFIFPLFLIIRFKVWRKEYRLSKEWAKRTLYLPNNYYADFLPLLLLLFLSVDNRWILLVAAVHLILFPRLFLKFVDDSIPIWKSLKVLRREMWIRFLLASRHWGNWLIIKIFLLFGADLVKENLSAVGYLKKLFKIK